VLELSAKRPYSKPALTSGKVALGVFGDYSQDSKDPRFCSLPTLIKVELSQGIDL
jgi:hypothetical protein